MTDEKQLFVPDTEVIVVGNGPAGIALSAFLSGYHPVYNARKPHPDPVIHENLSATQQSLLLQTDIESWYAQEYEQRMPIVGIYSDLYDRLMRPEPAMMSATPMVGSKSGADPAAPLAHTNATGSPASCLLYARCAERAVPHVVLGDTRVGGSWNQYDDNMETVSLASWMDLPAYSLAEWMGGRPLVARLPAEIIREYMHAYVKKLGLTDNFKEQTTVTNITKICSDLTEEEYWRVQGHHADGTRFELTSRRLVLACGRKRHKMLEVEGETNAMNLVYNVRALKQLLRQQADLNRAGCFLDACERNDFPFVMSSDNSNSQNIGHDGDNERPVVVVGDGISAADAILYCLENAMPVVHVFRRTEKQLKSTMLARLSSSIYPEYARVFALMLERSQHRYYKRLPASVVTAIRPDSRVILQTRGLDNNGKEAQEELQMAYRCLVICVGLQTELTMMEEKHDFLADYRSQQDPTLYAIGSVVGDHFVRYLVGGAFRVAQHLLREQIAEERARLKLDRILEAAAVADKTPFCCPPSRWNDANNNTNTGKNHGRGDETTANSRCLLADYYHQQCDALKTRMMDTFCAVLSRRCLPSNLRRRCPCRRSSNTDGNNLMDLRYRSISDNRIEEEQVEEEEEDDRVLDAKEQNQRIRSEKKTRRRRRRKESRQNRSRHERPKCDGNL